MPTESAKRTCEVCKGAIPDRMARQRNAKGQLVCDSCKGLNMPTWSTTHSSLSIIDQSEMKRREAEAITSIARTRRMQREGHDSGDNAIVNHCPFCGSGAVVGGSDGSVTCDFCHTPFTVQVQPAHPFMPQTIDGQPITPPGMPGGEETEMSAPNDPTVEQTDEDVAADPLGDADPTASNGPVAPGQPPSKQPAPFGKADPSTNPGKGEDGKKKPGGGKPPWLKSKSSANESIDRALAEKAKSMTVREFISHQHSGSRGCTCPPSYRRCRWAEFWERAQAGHYDEKAPKQSFRTATGATLDAQAYMAHLALQHADDRDAVLDTVRLANMTRQATDEPDACPNCGGSGELPTNNPSHPAYQQFTSCPDCDGTGYKKTSAVVPPFVREAGANGSLPEGVTFEEEWGLPGLLDDERMVSAHLNGRRIAWLVWQPSDGRINVVVVEPEHRRQGLATRLLQEARRRDPNVRHDDPVRQTPDGKQWVQHAAADKGLVRHQVLAEDIQVGDRLDISGKTRVEQIHPRTDKVLVKTQTTGTRSPSIKSWQRGETVTVWRKP